MENRGDDAGLNRAALLRDNAEALRKCGEHGCEYILIDGEYRVELPEC